MYIDFTFNCLFSEVLFFHVSRMPPYYGAQHGLDSVAFRAMRRRNWSRMTLGPNGSCFYDMKRPDSNKRVVVKTLHETNQLGGGFKYETSILEGLDFWGGGFFLHIFRF